MGSIPNSSAPLQACACQIFKQRYPVAPESKVRLAAAGRLRSAVALELAAGKVWALLDAVQPLVGSTAATARVHPAWVRRHGLARRCRFPPRLRKGGDASVLGRLGIPSSRGRRNAPLLKDGEAGPRAGLSRPGQPRRQPDASRPTVPAAPSLKWAWAHETGSRSSTGPDAGA
jgi:hypothetical protein